jgi:hypothetical protein
MDSSWFEQILVNYIYLSANNTHIKCSSFQGHNVKIFYQAFLLPIILNICVEVYVIKFVLRYMW